jgi:SAM-dependent methyltransferase
VPVQRILTYLFFSKKRFIYQDDPDVFRAIYTNNVWSSEESYSGGGSHIETTVKIRKALPVLWEKYGIKTFLDVPCGDYNWMKEVDKKNIVYVGGDIVEEIIDHNNQYYKNVNVSFSVMDIIKDYLPKVDMIFCKDCLQHLSYDNVSKALINFKRSGSKYLLTTSYPLTWFNWDICNGNYRALNLRIRPFKLPKPIYKIHEDSKGYEMEADKFFYLYELEKIKL